MIPRATNAHCAFCHFALTPKAIDDVAAQDDRLVESAAKALHPEEATDQEDGTTEEVLEACRLIRENPSLRRVLNPVDDLDSDIVVFVRGEVAVGDVEAERRPSGVLACLLRGLDPRAGSLADHVGLTLRDRPHDVQEGTLIRIVITGLDRERRV